MDFNLIERVIGAHDFGYTNPVGMSIDPIKGPIVKTSCTGLWTATYIQPMPSCQDYKIWVESLLTSFLGDPFSQSSKCENQINLKTWVHLIHVIELNF